MPCCDSVNSKKTHLKCPECKQVGSHVSSQTLLHQVQYPDNQQINQDDYAFCPTQQCDTVYFSQVRTINKQQVHVFKHTQQAMLCYCFDISELTYQAALASGTAKVIKDFVVQQTKSAVCACAIRNPAGRCCLANFTKMEQDDARQ